MFRFPVVYLCLAFVLATPYVAKGDAYSVKLTVTSRLPSNVGDIPLERAIDFSQLLKEVKAEGFFDPNSIVVVNLATGKVVPHLRTEDFAYREKGRVQWVIRDPAHKRYEIRFQTVETQPVLQPQAIVPIIGTGDLLRYNAGAARPVSACRVSSFVDLTGDGKRDLVGVWIYGHDPNFPWDGIYCLPQTGDGQEFEFGDWVRLRRPAENGRAGSEFFTGASRFIGADFADFDGDGLADLVYTRMGLDNIRFYRHSGKQDASGMPVFVDAGQVAVERYNAYLVRAVDLDNDGVMDVVINQNPNNGLYAFIRNQNPKGLPFEPSEPLTWQLNRQACFLDVDGDGYLDAVSLGPDPAGRGIASKIIWRRNLGRDVPQLSEPQSLDIDVAQPKSLTAVTDGPELGLLIGYDDGQRVGFFERMENSEGQVTFRSKGPAVSDSAVMTMGDQPSPSICDWDNDGDWDLLVGNGMGWPRILINEGTNQQPAFREADQIESEGEPIRLVRSEILGKPYVGHNMGYPFPMFVKWDGDDLPDLVIPNETNRIFWYQNIGTLEEPKFGPQQQLVVDGYPDSPAHRTASAEAAASNGPRGVYPFQATRPFYWRTGAALGDFNGDGLMDIATLDGEGQNLILYTQYASDDGQRHLERYGELKLSDGRLINDTLVGGNNGWAESFDAIDWDGDGLIDLVYSLAGITDGTWSDWGRWLDGKNTDRDSVYFLKNVGSSSKPVFDSPRPLRCYGRPIAVSRHGPHPAIGDVTGDGKPDVLTYTEWGVFPVFSYAVTAMPSHPKCVLGKVQKLVK